MNFNKHESSSTTQDKHLHLLEGSDHLKYYSENNTRSSSMDTEPKLEIKSQIISDKVNVENNSSRPKIGLVKEGFWSFRKINNIERYNFYIERYNEDINRYKNIKLKTIPFNKFLSQIYDFYTIYLRFLLAIFLITSSEIAEKYELKYFIRFSEFYTINGPTYKLRKERNWIVIIISTFMLSINYYILTNNFYLILGPALLFFMLSLYSYYYVRKNDKIIKNNIYRSMIYDEELNKTSKLNDYIIITPRNINEFLGCSYFTYLVYLYRKHNTNLPHQFMLYGDNYKSEPKIIKNFLLSHLIFILFVSVYQLSIIFI